MAVLLLLLRASVVIAVAFAVSHALRRRSAAVRADLWRATFVALAVLPLAAVLLPGLPWLPALESKAWIPESSPDDSTANDRPELSMLDAPHQEWATDPEAASGGPARTGTRLVGVSASSATAMPSQSSHWIDNLLLLWIGGALLQVLRLVSGLRRASLIARNAERPHESGRVRIVTSRAAKSAFVWDPRPFARPVVVLPHSDSIDPAWRDAVLAHEMHHVERGDGAFLPFATLVAALYWPTPLARVALRRLRLEIEHAADDAVLRTGMRPTDYATGLVALASEPRPVPVPTMSAWGTMPRRVEALLDAGADRRTTSRRARVMGLLATLTVCAPIATMTSSAATQGRQGEEATVDPKEARRQMRERAIDALVTMQDEETGAWRGDVGFKLNNGWSVTNRDVPHVGVTGLAVEALLLAGVQLDESVRGQALDRGIEFLLEHQDDDGYFTANGTRMRGHAYALRALATALLSNSDLVPMVAEGVAFSRASQSPTTGGWRFVPRATDSDIVETAHQVDANASGVFSVCAADRSAAIRLSKDNPKPLKSAFDYGQSTQITDPQARQYGAYRFQVDPRARVTTNTTAAGIRIAREIIYNDLPLWEACVRQLEQMRAERAQRLPSSAEHFLTWDAELIAERGFDFLVSTGGDPVMEPARVWRGGTVRWLTEHQLPDGSWKCSIGPGDAYFTAIGCVLLAEN